MRRGRFVLLLAMPLAPVLAACATGGGTPPGGAAGARATPVTLTGGLVPPPRSIEDVTALLERPRLADPRALGRARERADEKPPEGAGPDDLSRFYFKRGQAAGEAGRARQEIEDLTAAAEWAAKGSGRNEHEILQALSFAEVVGGNFSRGIERMRRAITKIPRFQEGWGAAFHGNLASMYARAGEIETAEAELTLALRDWEAANRFRIFIPSWALAAMAASLSEARGSLAEARGRLVEAEGFYREAVGALAGHRRWERDPWPDYLRGRVAQALVRQERFLEAEAEARRALQSALAKRGRDSVHTANVLEILVHVVFEQGRVAEAEALARAAIDIYEKTGVLPDSLLFAVARTWLAAAHVVQRRWTDALVQYEAIRVGMAGDPEAHRRYLAGDFGWALALLHTGRADEALPILREALARSEGFGEKFATAAQVRGLIAMAHAARGDRRQALRDFREAMPLLLDRSLEPEEETATRTMRDELLGIIAASYVGLLAEVRGTDLEREAGLDAAAEAFPVAEAARGRRVQRALDASAARAAAGTPALAELVRREQDARKQVTALFGLVAAVLAKPADRQDAAALARLRAEAAALRETRRALTARIAREFPAYARLVAPPALGLADVRRHLRRGEALIATYTTDERTFVWAVPDEGAVAFAAVPLGTKAMEADVARLRRALDPRARTLGEIPEFDVALAHRFYVALLGPVRAGWEGAQTLLVVAHGPLAQLPLALLPTAPGAPVSDSGPLFSGYRVVPWLGRTHAVTVLPSVTALATLRALPPGAAARRPFVGFGDPYFTAEQARGAAREEARRDEAALAPRGVPVVLRDLAVQSLASARLASLPRLPDTAEEVRSIAAALDADLTRDVFLGERANEKNVKTLGLAQYRVIAFATHGLVPGDLDGLTQPALALSAPEVAGVDGDGLLTMEEVLGLRLDADWVVLSACNTASGQGAGAEAISGLGRAFFYAGARALLVSAWPVETTSARALTTGLFTRQSRNPGLSRARALQETMNTLIDEGGIVDPATGRMVASYAHPIFWAPFTLVGDGGAAAPR